MAIRTTDYVKFIRGTSAAFEALSIKDPNTLYFISEDGATTGTLYLGSKLIAGGVGTSALGTVIIENIGDKQILYYDYMSSAWVNGTINDVIGTMKGATDRTDGTSGLVPVPTAGKQNKFLRGDGTWQDAVTFNTNVFNVSEDSSTPVTLKGFDVAEDGMIMRKSITGDIHSIEWVSQDDFLSVVNNEITTIKQMIERIDGGVSRTIVESLEAIDVTAEDAEAYIYMVPKADTSGTNNMYDEYMVINGKLEQIGANLSGEITGYVTTANFNTAVGNLNNKFSNYVTLEKYNREIGNLSSAILDTWSKDTLVDQVDLLTDLLTWYQL